MTRIAITGEALRRVNELRRIGARHLDRKEWSEVVQVAIDKTKASNRALLDFTAEVTPASINRKPEHMYVAADAMVVRADIILGVEMALVEAEETLAEITAMAETDIDSARRDRLVQKISAARDAVARAIRARGEA